MQATVALSGSPTSYCSSCGVAQGPDKEKVALASSRRVGTLSNKIDGSFQRRGGGARKHQQLKLVSSLTGRRLQSEQKGNRNIRPQAGRGVITADWKELTGVVVLSAFPFLFVKYLAEGPTGDRLLENAQKTKAEFEPRKEELQEKQEEARQESMWYGPARPKWLGPLPFEYPQHLTGLYPADYGYDILNLGADPTNFKKYFNFEILHARWAMLGALGALVPEVLQYFSALNFGEPVWWNVGYAKLQGDDIDYFGIPGLHIAGGQGILIIAFCQVILMLGPEYARATGIAALEPVGLYLPGDENYPGGALFDPLGLADDPAAFEDLKIKEMKNGRLAMVAWLGFFAQAAVTQKGPLENLIDFASDPAHNNVFTTLGSQ